MRNSTHLVFDNIIRRIWNLPGISHTSIVHSVGSVVSIHNIVCNRFSSLCSTAMFHPSSLVRTILLTVLAPVIQTLLDTTICMALVIASLMHMITLPLVI